MKKGLLLIATLLGGLFVFLSLLRLLPDEWSEKLSRLPAFMIKWMMEHMPDE